MALAEVDVQVGRGEASAPRDENRIVVSAPAELFWVLFVLAGDKPPSQHHVDIPPTTARRLRKRIHDFWNDGCTCYPELVVLAGRGGHLEDASNEAFLTALPRLGQAPLERGILGCEAPADRSLIRSRLNTLRTDGVVLRSYTRLVSEAWALVRPVWEREGQAEVRRIAEGWRQQVERGAKLLTVTMPGAGPGVADILDGAVRAAADARLLVAPTYFGGGYMVVDAPGSAILSTSGEKAHPARSVRTEAEKAAPRFKALADPTRLAILSLLQARPLGISEVARRLELSQPTVSAHFNALRGAGLVVTETDGRAVRYTLNIERLDKILGEVRKLVIEGSC